MNILKKMFFASLVCVFYSCSENNSESPEAAICDSSTTEFKEIYSPLASSNLDHVSMDLEIHGYKFEVLSAKNICSIGYQSISSMETIPYRIEIYNNTTSALIYSGDHLFASTAITYVSVGSIAVTPGNSYTIRRVQTNWGSDIGNTIGRVVTNFSGNYNFPITQGDLKINSGIFGYAPADESNSYTNLPYIDIVFEQ